MEVQTSLEAIKTGLNECVIGGPKAGWAFRDRRPQGCGRPSLQGCIHGVSRKAHPASGLQVQWLSRYH